MEDWLASDVSTTTDGGLDHVIESPERWLVTGVAGFIGSHLLEALLGSGRHVTGVDDFSGGTVANLRDVRDRVGPGLWRRLHLLRGDIRRQEVCCAAMSGVAVVSHQAALNSVPRSIKIPADVAAVNVVGTVNLMQAAAEAGVRRFVYASSSSVYGGSTEPVRSEDSLGPPLSPYAASKLAGEHFAAAFGSSLGLSTVGLRYFNVFGPRQNPNGPYSAVIPRWISALLKGDQPEIYGDGRQTRDFTYVDNVVSANLLAAAADVTDSVFNVGTARGTTLLDLYRLIREAVVERHAALSAVDAHPRHVAARNADVRSAVASLRRAQRQLHYAPTVSLENGLTLTADWFVARSASGHLPTRLLL